MTPTAATDATTSASVAAVSRRGLGSGSRTAANPATSSATRNSGAELRPRPSAGSRRRAIGRPRASPGTAAAQPASVRTGEPAGAKRTAAASAATPNSAGQVTRYAAPGSRTASATPSSVNQP